MKILINYATPEYAHARRINTASGYAIGGFDKVIEYSPEDIDGDFRRKNEHILKHKMGGGFWLWKPYIIKKTLAEMGEGDFLFYADAGSLFMSPIEPLIKAMRQKQQDVLPFLQTISRDRIFPEHHYTKRDAFVLMGCDSAEYADSKQLWGAFSLWRKTAFSMNLVNEWLFYAQDERIITDIPNQCGKKNYPGFRNNRHDQSIFSLLCKKHQLEGYIAPAFINQFHKDIAMSCAPSFFLRHPLKFRLHFLILREVHSAIGWSNFLIFWLKRIKVALAGLSFLNWTRRRGKY